MLFQTHPDSSDGKDLNESLRNEERDASLWLSLWLKQVAGMWALVDREEMEDLIMNLGGEIHGIGDDSDDRTAREGGREATGSLREQLG